MEFVDPYDAAEAQYHMNRQVIFGREITVVVAAETRKRPDDMRNRARVRYVIPCLLRSSSLVFSVIFSFEMTVVALLCRGYSGEHGRRHYRSGTFLHH